MFEYTSVMEIIRSIILIIAAILIVITAIGILKLNNEMDKVIYVRLHMLGVMDLASVLALIGLNQPLLAGIYFILAPFLAHAMANAYYYQEDEKKYENTSEPNNLTSKTKEEKA
ncbi:MAG: cation:proton antiporter [Methanobacteriaceae archaeon]|nr:cation:proton antiporter [Candidatus Methanorudis spinitermitis]